LIDALAPTTLTGTPEQLGGVTPLAAVWRFAARLQQLPSGSVVSATKVLPPGCG
jgi:hypothetical protein